MSVQRFYRIACPGRTESGRVFYEIEMSIQDEKQRLSITGVEGPKRNGDCIGGCGQHKVKCEEFLEWFDGWTPEKHDRFIEVWDEWHLNDMRAGCEHQREFGWRTQPNSCQYRPAGKPCECPEPKGMAFGPRIDAQANRDLKRRFGTPSGCKADMLSIPCPVCGYEYGSAWLYSPLPRSIVSEIKAIPETSISYPWGKQL